MSMISLRAFGHLHDDLRTGEWRSGHQLAINELGVECMYKLVRSVGVRLQQRIGIRHWFFIPHPLMVMPAIPEEAEYKHENRGHEKIHVPRCEDCCNLSFTTVFQLLGFVPKDLRIVL